MEYLKKYNQSELNEGSIKSNFITSLIAMSLLSSCNVFKHHKHKEKTNDMGASAYNYVPNPKDEEELQKKYGTYGINNTPKTNNVKPHNNTKSTNFSHLPWPVEKGTITSKFGKQFCDNAKKVCIDNKGIFIKTIAHSKVHPVFKGRITKIFNVCGEETIIITHDDIYYTVYSGFTTLDKNIKLHKNVDINTLLGYSKDEISFQVWK